MDSGVHADFSYQGRFSGTVAGAAVGLAVGSVVGALPAAAVAQSVAGQTYYYDGNNYCVVSDPNQ